MRKRKNKNGFTPSPICIVVERVKTENKQFCRQISNSLAVRKLVRGFTLVELIIAFAIIVIIFAAVVPQFSAIRNSWTANEAKAEITQNGRVLAEHITRNLAAAKQIIAVSPSSDPDGFITFNDNNDIQKRYMLSGGYVVFGDVGSEAQLAGPVDRFQISCYSFDFNSTTTDANVIRLVRIETVFPNDDVMGTDKTFTASVYLQTNGNTGGIVGCWKLDETSGTTAADSSGNGNDGTLVNMSSPGCWVAGQIGNALNYDGSDDVVECGNPPSLQLSGTEISVSAWFNADTLVFGNWPSLVGKASNGDWTDGWGIYFYNNTICFYINDWSANVAYEAFTDTGLWHHVAGTYDGTRIKIYVDGVKGTDDSYNGAINDGGDVTIGEIGGWTSGCWDGKIDDVRIYNRVLSAEEIAQLANVLRYRDCNEAKQGSDTTSIAISTPATNTGDLLIAAIATDEDTSASIAAPVGQGWTLIDRGNYSSAVTLGAWWKLAAASEPASHTFTWTGNQKAYGWMMRFTGHDPTNPINIYSTYGESSATPTSPAVTTTVDNCLILRLGGFDDDDITVDNPGLSGHTAITADSSGGSSASPTYRAAGTARSGTGAITVPWPAHQSGDVALLFVESCGGQAATLSAPQGFANVTNSPQATGTGVNGTRITVFWCRATSSSMNSPVVADPGDHVYGRILTFRGVITTGNPWDVTAGGTKATASTTTTFGTVTTTVDNDLIVLAASRDNDSAAVAWSGWTNANLSSLTERQDGGTTSGNGGGVGVATGVKSTAGAIGSSTATVTSSVDGHMTIALKPVGAGTVSGGAGYVRQATAGSSGTSTFTIGSSNEARTLTIAIAPANDSYDDCCQDNIVP